MAESQTQDTGTTGGSYERAGAGSTSGRGTGFFTHRVWLWILLMLLVVVLFTYDQVAFKDFRENAYSRSGPLVAEWSQKAKRLYECGIPGCKSVKPPAAPAAATATAKPGELAVANPTGNPAQAGASAAQPAAALTSAAPTTLPATEAQAPVGQAPAGAANSYPAYPEYPPYPSYPPYYGFGNGSSADTTSGTASNSPAPAAPQEFASAKPYQAPVAPTPPKPEASPGKPAYPNYPAYPSYPSGVGAASPSPQAASQPPINAQAYPPPVADKQAQSASVPPKMLPVAPPVRPEQSATKGADLRPGQSLERQTGQVAADSLFRARQAAATGRFPEAVHEYLQYLTKHPEDGNAYGELGNVYLTVGRFQEAAQNYYEVATRLVDLGQLAALPRLMPIIERYEPRLAVLIHQKIANRSRGQPH